MTTCDWLRTHNSCQVTRQQAIQVSLGGVADMQAKAAAALGCRQANMAERSGNRHAFMNESEVQRYDKWQSTKSQQNKRTVGNDFLLRVQGDVTKCFNLVS